MKSEEAASVSSDAAESKLRVDWPPNFLRLLLGALVAAGLGFVVLKAIHPIFIVPPEIAVVLETAPIEEQWELEKTQFAVDGKNFSILFGIIGAILGACCVVFPFGAKQIKAAIIAAVVSAVLGIVGANLSNWMFDHLRMTSGTDTIIMGFELDGMSQRIIGYAMLWGMIGLGAGLGVGAVRGIGKSLVAGISGLAGGVLAAMAYVILTAQISLNAMMNRVLPPDNTGIAIWLLLFSVVIAGCIAAGTGERRKKVAA